MRRIPLIALVLGTMLAPLAADAQVSIRRLPGQKAIILKDGKEATAPRNEIDCAEPATEKPATPAGGNQPPAAKASTAPAAVLKDDPRAAAATQPDPADTNEAGCTPAATEVAP